MQTGALTGYIDVAQMVLYAFWLFLAGVVYYLRREDKREGYPLQSDRTERTTRVRVQGFPAIPPPKTFRLAHGGVVMAPAAPREDPEPSARPTAPWPGAPLEPVGDPLGSRLGPAAYANRSDHPDVTIDGQPRIVPMRVATDFSVEERDPDPRGMPVFGADGRVGGHVSDIWVDRSEPQVRYLEIETTPDAKRVLVPIALTKISTAPFRRRVIVQSMLGAQFNGAPALANPDQVTLREEDHTSAYFAGGNLYATRERSEPLL
jgi:photosynthetic reaction center H subunit